MNAEQEAILLGEFLKSENWKPNLRRIRTATGLSEKMIRNYITKVVKNELVGKKLTVSIKIEARDP